jgi:hypothetical protein
MFSANSVPYYLAGQVLPQPREEYVYLYHMQLHKDKGPHIAVALCKPRWHC